MDSFDNVASRRLGSTRSWRPGKLVVPALAATCGADAAEDAPGVRPSPSVFPESWSHPVTHAALSRVTTPAAPKNEPRIPKKTRSRFTINQPRYERLITPQPMRLPALPGVENL